MAYDGIVTKSISKELQNLSSARVDKIFQPNKNEILIGCYLNKKNYLLNICTDSQNHRVILTTHQKSNPSIATNFCMVLRKHLLGLHIKNFITNNLERVITIEFEGFDDIDDIISKKLIIELMGKHCNVVLLDDQNIIIDSLRHISGENSTRNIIPKSKYIYPTMSKKNFLDSTFDEFFKILMDNSIDEIKNILSKEYNGISHSFISSRLQKLAIRQVNKNTMKLLYDDLLNIIFASDTNNVILKYFGDKNDDYVIDYTDCSQENFSLNFFLDDFYYVKESNIEFKNFYNIISKMILSILNKYKKRLKNMNEKLNECENMEKYKLYGELITANLYKIDNKNISSITLENYYDNNKTIEIVLNKKYSPLENSKLFFKKYNKLKNTLEIVTKQKKETINEIDYIESVVYELENSKTIDDLYLIFDEISSNDIFENNFKKQVNKKKNKIKKSSLTKNKTASFNPLKYSINNFQLFVGRNNKENDYLTLKYASKSDLWFHTKDIHGSHAILKLNRNEYPDENTLIKCAEIVSYYSKARNSSNVPVDYCYVKYVKKPNNAKPGMVIYSNNHTLYVNPKL